MRKVGMGVNQNGIDLAAENVELKKKIADLAAENAKLMKALKKSEKKGKAGDRDGAAEGAEEQKPSESDTSAEK